MSNTIHVEPPAIEVKMVKGEANKKIFSFTKPFNIGRDETCEVQLEDQSVSRIHAEIYFREHGWWIRDQGSANGIYINGKKVDRFPITKSVQIELGLDGPILSLEVKEASESYATLVKKGPSVTQYVRQYFDGSLQKSAGQRTLFIRKAFERVQKKQRGKYLIIIGTIVSLLFIAGGIVVFQQIQLKKQKQLAISNFYDIKNLELEFTRFKDKYEVEEIEEYENSLKTMNENYDQQLENLGVYGKNMSEVDRLILKVARIFGECELNMPDKMFTQEVKKYIKEWQRAKKDFTLGVNTAVDNNYIEKISVEMLNNNLPPQFLYLAFQESKFDKDACGPPTSWGYAKGMWQFIPDTARRYGLRVGPLFEYRRPDSQDERHDFEKSTAAAAKYLRFIYNTDAQASGLLVMASYNWGERRVIKRINEMDKTSLELINELPRNPRDRNFWSFLEMYVDQIPKQTYDYVFRIFSAAVIGENPKHFGFDFDNPLAVINDQMNR